MIELRSYADINILRLLCISYLIANEYPFPIFPPKSPPFSHNVFGRSINRLIPCWSIHKILWKTEYLVPFFSDFQYLFAQHHEYVAAPCNFRQHRRGGEELETGEAGPARARCFLPFCLCCRCRQARE